MAGKTVELSPQLKALQKTDLSPMIRMSGLIVPRALKNFLPTLNNKQRSAIDKVMPPDEGKKIFLHLVGTPTPPIVVELAQPLKMTTLSEDEIKKQQIKGLRVELQDLQIMLQDQKKGKVLKFLWRMKGQLGTLIGLSGNFLPLIRLGPSELKDLRNKAMVHFKPVLDLMPH